jgi:CelD/BcsL family acetyltransferase involved in cellulose biosynthesis
MSKICRDVTDPGPWRWECGQGSEAIDRVAAAWDRLSHGADFAPWGDAIWTRCYWRAFGNTHQDLVVHALYHGDDLAAVLPLERRGSLVPRWSSLENPHTAYWVVAVDEARLDMAGRILDHLLQSARWLKIRHVHRGNPLLEALVEAARARSLHVADQDSSKDILIDLPDSWEAFRKNVSKNLDQDTRRKLRSLERMGKLEFEVVTGGDRLDSVLQECFRVETLGWKAESGSPILSKPETVQLYTDLAHAAAAAGRLALYTLRLDSRLVAWEYCLVSRHEIEMFKLSFDPALGRCSPGNILRYKLLQFEIERGQVKVYHLGRSSDPGDWKYRWATRAEPLCWVQVYGAGVVSSLAYRLGTQIPTWARRHPQIKRSAAGLRATARRMLGRG